MKKWISLILTVLILATACAPAYAMEKAASMPDEDLLEKYASYEENGTIWTVRSNQGAAALARIAAETAPYSGYACFGMELTGDSATGLTVPVLAFYYAGSEDLNADMAYVAVNGVRYDLKLTCEKLSLGKNYAERLTVALNEEGLSMVRDMLNAEEITIALVGDKTFEIKPEKKDTYASAKAELAARSMDALADMLALFDTTGGYDLWDLNDSWWQRMYGTEPAMQTVKLPEDEIEINEELTISLEEPMYMLSRGDNGSDVRDLQKLLIACGYLQGTADGGYGEGTVRAVRAAQTFLGLMPTGNADEALIRLLSGEAVADNAVVSAETSEVVSLGGVCELTIDRFWIADAVESVGGDRRTASDADDTLLIYEGTVKNLSVDELDFYWQLTAEAGFGDYSFDCTLACERNDGATLSSTLPPLGEARLLIYAEVPEIAADANDWQLTVTANGESLTVGE